METVTNPASDVIDLGTQIVVGGVDIPLSWGFTDSPIIFGYNLGVSFLANGDLIVVRSAGDYGIRREVLDRLKITVTQAGQTYETIGVFDFGVDTPWQWTPSNSVEAMAFYQHLDVSQTAVFTLQVVGIAELIGSVLG